MRIQIFWKPFVPWHSLCYRSTSPQKIRLIGTCVPPFTRTKVFDWNHILLCVCGCIFQQKVTAIVLLFPDMYCCRAFKKKDDRSESLPWYFLNGEFKYFLNTIVPWHRYCSTSPQKSRYLPSSEQKKIIISQRVFQNNDIQIFRNLEIRINKDYV